MNTPDNRELEIVVEAGRLKCLQRVREAADPDPVDILVVSQWRAETLAGRARGPWATLRTYGPHWGVGAGAGSVLIAVIEAVGRIVGR